MQASSDRFVFNRRTTRPKDSCFFQASFKTARLGDGLADEGQAVELEGPDAAG